MTVVYPNGLQRQPIALNLRLGDGAILVILLALLSPATSVGLAPWIETAAHPVADESHLFGNLDPASDRNQGPEVQTAEVDSSHNDGHIACALTVIESDCLGLVQAYSDPPGLSNESWLRLPQFLQPNATGAGWYLPFAYDPALGYSVLYDCLDTCGIPQTWIFCNETWSRLNLSTQPAPGLWSMAYDEFDGYLLMYGSAAGSGLPETWEFSGGRWVNETSNVSSPEPTGGTITYDGFDREIILYGGGNSTTNQLSNATWEYRNSSWREVNTSGPTPDPSAATTESLVYDPAAQSVVFFAGTSNITYLYRSGVWREVNSPLPISSGVAGGSLVYDSLSQLVLFFGGVTYQNFTYTYYNELWGFNGTAWAALHPTTSPPANDYTSLTYDSGNGRVVEWGGTQVNQTWIWGAANLSFDSTPADGGSIHFGNQTYNGSTSAWLPFGDYTGAADPDPGHYLSNLTMSGDLSESSGTYVLTGNASLTATFGIDPAVTLESRPWECGVDFNGTNYTDGSAPIARPGTYALSAPACPNVVFAGWNVTGNASVSNRSDPDTTLTITGPSTVVAEFLVSFGIYVSPTNGGEVWVNGSMVPSGTLLDWVGGNYSLRVQASPGWRFGGYTPAGGVSVSGGLLELEYSGGLLVNFLPYPTIAFATNLANCSTVVFNNTTYAASTSTPVDLGNYAVSAPACSGGLFQRWNATGEVNVSVFTAANATVEVTGNGTLEAEYEPAAWVLLDVDPSSAAGSVRWDGNPIVAGAEFETPLGLHQLTPVPAAGWKFRWWNYTGGVSVATDTVNLTWNGTITAVFGQPVASPNGTTGSGPGFTWFEGGLLASGVLAATAVALLWRRRAARRPSGGGTEPSTSDLEHGTPEN